MDSWSGSHHYYEGRDSSSSWSSSDEWDGDDDALSVYKYYDGYLDSEQQQTDNAPSVVNNNTVPQSRFSDATSDDDDCWRAYECYDGYSDTDTQQNVHTYSNTSVVDRSIKRVLDTTTGSTKRVPDTTAGSTKRVPDITAEVCQYYTSNYTKTDRASYDSNSSSESDGYYKQSEHVHDLRDININDLHLNDQDTFTPMDTDTISDSPVTVSDSSVRSREGAIFHKKSATANEIYDKEENRQFELEDKRLSEAEGGMGELDNERLGDSEDKRLNELEENRQFELEDKRLGEAEDGMGELDNERLGDSEDKRLNELEHERPGDSEDKRLNELEDERPGDSEELEPMETDDADPRVTCDNNCSCRGGCSLFVTEMERRFSKISPSLTRCFLLSKVYKKIQEDEDTCCELYCCRDWWWVDYDLCMERLEDIFYD